MKAARLFGPGDVRMVDEPAPAPGAGECLVRVTAVGICGSDLHWFGEGRIGGSVLSRPLVLGHEVAGVAESGPLEGQAVAVDPAVPCGHCERCREGYYNLCPQGRFAGHGGTDGGLCQYMAWPVAELKPVPDNFSPATVALLEPLGVALHALDLGWERFAASVAVVGCGPIGLMLVELAKAAGASRVVAVEPLEHRRAAALRAGADEVVGPEEAGRLPEVDLSFEVAGNDAAVAAAVSLVRPGGRLVLVGIPDDDRTVLPAAEVRRKGLTIKLTRRMNEAYPRAIDVARRNVVELEWLVSATFELSRTREALASAARRDGLKVMVAPGA